MLTTKNRTFELTNELIFKGAFLNNEKVIEFTPSQCTFTKHYTDSLRINFRNYPDVFWDTYSVFLTISYVDGEILINDSFLKQTYSLKVSQDKQLELIQFKKNIIFLVKKFTTGILNDVETFNLVLANEELNESIEHQIELSPLFLKAIVYSAQTIVKNVEIPIEVTESFIQKLIDCKKSYPRYYEILQGLENKNLTLKEILIMFHENLLTGSSNKEAS